METVRAYGRAARRLILHRFQLVKRSATDGEKGPAGFEKRGVPASPFSPRQARSGEAVWWRIFGGGVALLLVSPGRALATQVHAAPEGLYAHQMAHCFFVLSMGIFIYQLRERRLVKEAGWRLVQYAGCFFILWNLDAVVAHYLDDRSDFFRVINGGSWSSRIHPMEASAPLTFLYYLVKLDHLFCVPAIVLLYAGLRRLLEGSKQA